MRLEIICIPATIFSTAVVTKPPYEITETGWGEFEIIIKIFFIDPNERPVSTFFGFNKPLFMCSVLCIYKTLTWDAVDQKKF